MKYREIEVDDYIQSKEKLLTHEEMKWKELKITDKMLFEKPKQEEIRKFYEAVAMDLLKGYCITSNYLINKHGVGKTRATRTMKNAEEIFAKQGLKIKKRIINKIYVLTLDR